MLLLQLVALLLLLVVTSVGPGLLVIRRLQWRPLETLCAAVALSHFLVYVAGMTIYALALPPEACYGVSILAVAANAACWTSLRSLWRARHVRHAVYAVAGLLCWVLLLQSVVRHYTGGNWYGDWFEHYERARFFLDRPDVDARFFLGRYILPARPPLMNVMAAFYMAQAGSGFEIFQVVFTFLNILPVLAAALLLPLLVRRPIAGAILLLAALCALNPLYVHNSLWTWTKLYAAFLVLLGLGLFIRGWRSGGRSRLIGAFAALAAATLAHYSAGPFLLFVALHYLAAVFWWRPHRWSELAGIAGIGTLVLSTWFAWSMHTYGRDTFEQNTTFAGYTEGGQTLADAAYNLYATVVPYPARGLTVPSMRYRTSMLAELRDRFFHLYQTNLVFAFGSIGWLLVMVLLVLPPRMKAPLRRRERRFWLAFSTFCILVGIATVGERQSYGSAHIIAPPLVALGLALLAAAFMRVPRALRLLLPVGLAVDYVVGIHLHVHLHSAVFRTIPSGTTWSVDMTSGLGYGTMHNFLLKHDAGLVFLGDHLVRARPLLEAAMAVAALTMILYVVRHARQRVARSADALRTAELSQTNAL